jgi:hypothetical protein
MDTKLLIDAIVRQTTVLIAQLSTAAGIRAPLAHVADQVFVALAKEIERQGVGRKVVADMFGMALRTYQKRVQRLSESASVRGRTLWQAVHEYLSERDAVRRADIEARFLRDTPEDLGAVLNDLVASGLVYVTGRGLDAVYRALSPSEQRAAIHQGSLGALADMAWLTIYRSRKLRLSELSSALGTSRDSALQAVERLVAEGIVQRSEDAEDPLLRAESFVIPVSSQRGWEAAVFDHFSTVCAAIAAKIQVGSGAREGEAVGGATFSFDVYSGHPFQERVTALLTRTRAEVDALWNEVASYNRAHPVADEQKTKVSFYFGQNVQDRGTAPRSPASWDRDPDAETDS